MGTALFTVYKYGRAGKGSQASALPSTDQITSGKFTTSTTAANLEDNTATDVTLAVGQVLGVILSEDGWVNFAGNTAASGIGHALPANIYREFECNTAGLVSIIDDA